MRSLSLRIIPMCQQTLCCQTSFLIPKLLGLAPSSSVHYIFGKKGDLFNFTVAPYRFETGSVVVTWLFDNIEPGETKSVSYTVEKELGEEVLDEFEAPQVVAAGAGLPETRQAIAAPQGTAEQPGSTQGGTPFDWTPVVLVGLMVVVGAVIFFFARKTR